MSALIDLDTLTSDDLAHLAHLRREAERSDAERRVALALDLIDRPALGYYRRKAGDS